MIRMIPLPYPLNALEPYYSKETLEIHYHTLYKGYVDNTNKTLEKLEKARLNNQFEGVKCLESFYGSGAILHQLFFENMGVPIPSLPSNALMEQIIKDFGSFDKCQNQFIEAAKTVEASRLVYLSMGTQFSKTRNFTVRKTSESNLMGM